MYDSSYRAPRIKRMALTSEGQPQFEMKPNDGTESLRSAARTGYQGAKVGVTRREAGGR